MRFTTAWGAASVPGLAPDGRYLQYGSIRSNDPWTLFHALTTPPAPALQLIPLPGVSPEQETAVVALGAPAGSNTCGLGSKSSTVREVAHPPRDDHAVRRDVLAAVELVVDEIRVVGGRRRINRQRTTAVRRRDRGRRSCRRHGGNQVPQPPSRPAAPADAISDSPQQDLQCRFQGRQWTPAPPIWRSLTEIVDFRIERPVPRCPRGAVRPGGTARSVGLTGEVSRAAGRARRPARRRRRSRSARRRRLGSRRPSPGGPPPAAHRPRRAGRRAPRSACSRSRGQRRRDGARRGSR